MAYKGISRDRIVEAARELLERDGLGGFSLRTLAASLGVRVSSLYNHIDGQEELLTTLGLRGVDELCAALETAVAGKRRDVALFALGRAYRDFARAHPQLYRLIMGAHGLRLPALEESVTRISGPIFRLVEDYGIDGTAGIHAQRLLRSVMHGFYAHEQLGSFTLAEADREESYRFALESVAAQFERMGGEGQA
ncbi:MAG: TetR/AcrR family transcriptional regulator [Oscillospiraceae bacterium]|nr:TetR/AcrR family transcriptional regulator [Oscillospiraceae bacterium]